jgi:hypothetical protein
MLTDDAGSLCTAMHINVGNLPIGVAGDLNPHKSGGVKLTAALRSRRRDEICGQLVLEDGEPVRVDAGCVERSP